MLVFRGVDYITIMAGQPIPPKKIVGLMIRAYYPLVSLNKAIKPLFPGGYVRGGWLTGHEEKP